MAAALALTKFFLQYLSQPLNLALTFLLPLAFCLIGRKYLWCSLPLTLLIEVIVRWEGFVYYESRGLFIIFTAMRLAVMALFVLLLYALIRKRARS